MIHDSRTTLCTLVEQCAFSRKENAICRSLRFFLGWYLTERNGCTSGEPFCTAELEARAFFQANIFATRASLCHRAEDIIRRMRYALRLSSNVNSLDVTMTFRRNQIRNTTCLERQRNGCDLSARLNENFNFSWRQSYFSQIL